METLFISEEIFRWHCPVKKRDIVDKFLPFISVSQKIYIREILGTPLTAELEEQIISNNISPQNRL